jgi:hypothetical protein
MSSVPEKHVFVHFRLTTELSRCVLFHVGEVALVERGVFQLDDHQEMTVPFSGQSLRVIKQSLLVISIPWLSFDAFFEYA